MMLEESVVGTGPSEFNDELDHHGKAALIKCFLQEVGPRFLFYSLTLLLRIWCKCVCSSNSKISLAVSWASSQTKISQISSATPAKTWLGRLPPAASSQQLGQYGATSTSRHPSTSFSQ